MLTFSDAFYQFKEDGHFRLEAGSLYTEQIEKLRLSAKFLGEDKPEIWPYHFHLSHVQFIPGYFPRPERVIDGAVVEQYAQGERYSVNTQMLSLDNFKSLLCCLLSQADTWSSIKLDWVFFTDKNQMSDYLKVDFHHDLLSSLAQATRTSLEELSLKPFSLSKNLPALIYFLTHNESLRILHLDLSEASGDDWLALSQALAVHPNVHRIDLGNTPFDEHASSALSRLLDKNYRLEEINIVGPGGDGVLMEAYNQLNRRLSIPGRLRFIEERLSQAQLLEVVFQALAEIQKIKLKQQAYKMDDKPHEKQTLLIKRVSFLVSNQGTLAITDAEKVTWLKGTCVLPSVYAHHSAYMKEFTSLIHLHLGGLTLGSPNTVGYLLLERALEVKDAQIIQYLLESNADLFEPPPEHLKKPFLVRLFEVEGPWQALVMSHLKKDLHVLVPAVKILSPYSDLAPICNRLKEHLTLYFTILEVRKKQPKLLRLLTGVMSNFQDRHEECARSFHHLVWYIKVATDDAAEKRVTYDSLFEAQEILDRILEDSRQANRGFLGRSKLHDDLLRLGKELNKELRLHQRELYYHEKNNSIHYLTDGREKDDVALEKAKIALVQEQKVREQERERHAQEQKEKDERHAQEKKEMKAKIEALERLMQAQSRVHDKTSEEATSSQEQAGGQAGGSAHFFARR